jgi:hypothetical protein
VRSERIVFLLKGDELMSVLKQVQTVSGHTMKIEPRLMRQTEGPIAVVVRLGTDCTSEALEALKQLGMRIDGRSRRIISGSLPAQQLVQLGELECVQAVERPQRYRLL